MQTRHRAEQRYFCYLTNEQILFLVKQKNTEAFAALYDRHAQIVYNLLVRIVHDIALAESLLQAVFFSYGKKRIPV